MVTYILGTLLMGLGWLCALAQGDASPGPPRIAGIVAIFVLALALLAPAAVHLWQTRHVVQIILLGVIGIEMLSCLYAIAAEFAL